MEEPCPICSRTFPVRFLERHVNSCLDTLERDTTEGETKLLSPVTTQENDRKPVSQNVFVSLGLKADSGKSSSDKFKKTGATLTSILLAEKRLKRKQEELETQIRKKQTVRDGRESENTYEILNPAQPAKEEDTVSDTVPLFRASINDVRSPESTQTATDSTDSKPKRIQEILQLRRDADLPLAQRLRPKSLSDFYGQEKIVGENGILRNLVALNQIPSFILWGVPGVGKTSLARIVALTSNHKFVELSGSDSNAKKLREAFANAQNEKQLTGQKTILFLDEIHRFNKAVQDLLLPVIENGTLTVIGATTENPSFTLNNALISRMHTFVMEPLPQKALVKILSRGLLLLNRTRKLLHNLHLIAMNRDAIDYIATLSGGDSRVALNILESVNAYLSGLQFKAFVKSEPDLETIDVPGNMCVGAGASADAASCAGAGAGVIQVTSANLQPLLKTRNFHHMYDKTGENHYDTISAFHKSVRGSNADAAVFYLVKMLSGGEDPLFIVRRMIVIASEDIGLRDSSCLPFAISAMEALQFVGMPEGEIVLAHCAVKLALAPKLTKSYRALRRAQSLLTENPEISRLPIPMHLRNAPTKLMKDLGYGDSYKYNPNYKHGLAKQAYFPPEFNDTKLVDDTHLGDAADSDVESQEYEKVDREQQDYEQFKGHYKNLISQKRFEKKRQSRSVAKARNLALARIGFLSSPVERLSSFDENLSPQDQPEYFEGAEIVEDADEREPGAPEADVNCSYDEFLKEI